MSFCRITGRSRGLPKPNYFPLLAPISPADAKRCCRITGKSYGLPSHHYIPVLLSTLSKTDKCKITNVADELGPHHYHPEFTYGKRKHIVVADYRYVYPVFDCNNPEQNGLIDLLNGKDIIDEGHFVYKVEERRCHLVFPAHMEAAVRDGDVRDVMFAKNSDTVLLKMKKGKSVSIDLQDYEESDEKLYEGEGPRDDVLLEREREDGRNRKINRKRKDNLSQMTKIFEDKDRVEKPEIVIKKIKKSKKLEKKEVEEEIITNGNGVNDSSVFGHMVQTSEGIEFYPLSKVEIENLPEGKIVPGNLIKQEMEAKFVPGIMVHTKVGPTFIPGQIMYTEEEGERFIPGEVIDTDDGPRFVPGCVVENGDKVTFVPGEIVDTPDGLKFIAPDLMSNSEGEQEFSVQSFLLSPKELGFIKPGHQWGSSGKTPNGELSMDSDMLRQLAEAGMTVGKQDESTTEIIHHSIKNKKIIQKYMEKSGIDLEKSDDVYTFFNELLSIVNKFDKPEMIVNGHSMNNSMNCDDYLTKLACTVLTVLTDESKICKKNIYESISQALEENLSEIGLENILNTFKTDGVKEKLEILVNKKMAVYLNEIKLNVIKKFNFNDPNHLIDKISSIIDDHDMSEALISICKNNPKIVLKIIENLKENSNKIICDVTATEIIQKSVISAVKQTTDDDLKQMLSSDNEPIFKNMLKQAVCLSKALGLTNVTSILCSVLNDKKNLEILLKDESALQLINRLNVMNKLSENNVELKECLLKLQTDPYTSRTDSNIRELVRKSGILTITADDKPELESSTQVPLSILQSENQLAMEDFLVRCRTKSKGAFLIVKRGYQAVVPRELSHDVLTGKVPYTLLDEDGIRHFEPLHVFSALKLSTPRSHRFTMYSSDVDDIEIETTSTCSSLSGCDVKVQNLKFKIPTKEITKIFLAKRLKNKQVSLQIYKKM